MVVTMQKKHPCKYCGGLTTADMCGPCKEKLELIRKLKQMKPPEKPKGVGSK